MNSPQPPCDAPPPPSRVPKSGVMFMLVIVVAMALLALYANVQRFRHGQVETVIVKPSISPSAPAQ